MERGENFGIYQVRSLKDIADLLLLSALFMMPSDFAGDQRIITLPAMGYLVAAFQVPVPL